MLSTGFSNNYSSYRAIVDANYSILSNLPLNKSDAKNEGDLLSYNQVKKAALLDHIVKTFVEMRKNKNLNLDKLRQLLEDCAQYPTHFYQHSPGKTETEIATQYFVFLKAFLIIAQEAQKIMAQMLDKISGWRGRAASALIKLDGVENTYEAKRKAINDLLHFAKELEELSKKELDTTKQILESYRKESLHHADHKHSHSKTLPPKPVVKTLSLDEKLDQLFEKRKKISLRINDSYKKIRDLKRLINLKTIFTPPYKVNYQLENNIKKILDPNNEYNTLAAAIADFNFSPSIKNQILNYENYKPDYYRHPRTQPKATPFEFLLGLFPNALLNNAIPEHALETDKLRKNLIIYNQLQSKIDKLNKAWKKKEKQKRLDSLIKQGKYILPTKTNLPSFFKLLDIIKKELNAYRSSTFRFIFDRESYNNSLVLEQQITGLLNSQLQAYEDNGKVFSAEDHYIQTTMKTLLAYRDNTNASKDFRFALNNIFYQFPMALNLSSEHFAKSIQILTTKISSKETALADLEQCLTYLTTHTNSLRLSETLDILFRKLGTNYDEVMKLFSIHIQGHFHLNRHLTLRRFPFSLWNDSPYSFLVNCLKQEIYQTKKLIKIQKTELFSLQEKAELRFCKEAIAQELQTTTQQIQESTILARKLAEDGQKCSRFLQDPKHAEAANLPLLLEKFHGKKESYAEAIKPFSEPVRKKLEVNQGMQKPNFFMSFFKDSPHTLFSACVRDELTSIKSKYSQEKDTFSRRQVKLLQLKKDAELIRLKEKVYNYFERTCKDTRNLTSTKYQKLLALRDSIKKSEDVEQVKSLIKEIKSNAEVHVNIDFDVFGLRDKPLSSRIFDQTFTNTDYTPDITPNSPKFMSGA